MYFKNRIDNQVKIKGHRIELDEITSSLIKFGIKKIHTIAFDNKIVAFYTDKKKFDKKSIDVYLRNNIPEYMISSSESLISIMVGNKLVNSNGDAKRMIKQGAVKINDEKISDIYLEVLPDSVKVLKVGKRKFLKIII